MDGALLSTNSDGKLLSHELPASDRSERNGEGDRGGRPSFHSGLSALLNAVTLELEDHDNGDGLTSTRRGTGNDKRPQHTMETSESMESSSDHEIAQPKSPANTTPTIVPENANIKQSFPGVLMTLLEDPINADTLIFLPGDKFFAIRVKKFSEDLLNRHFFIDTFASFQVQLITAGFTCIDTERDDIKVFRHPLFRKGDWVLCEKLRVSETFPTLDLTSQSSTPPTPHLGSSQGEMDKPSPSESSDSATKSSYSNSALAPTESEVNVKYTRLPLDENYIKARQSNTAKKMKLTEGDESLQGQAVVETTRAIVTDAIESLLRDEDHTRETFLKHRETLSKGVLHGIEPISKQLFSPESEDHGEGIQGEGKHTGAALRRLNSAPTSNNGVQQRRGSY